MTGNDQRMADGQQRKAAGDAEELAAKGQRGSESDVQMF